MHPFQATPENTGQESRVILQSCTCCVNKWYKMPTDQRVTASKVIQWQNHFSDSRISCNDSYHYQLCCFVSPCLMLGNYNHLAWHLYTSSMDSMYTGLNYHRSQYLDYQHWQALGSNTQHWQGSIFLCWLENCQFLLTAQATFNCHFFSSYVPNIPFSALIICFC